MLCQTITKIIRNWFRSLENVAGGTDAWLEEFYQEMYVKYGKDSNTFRLDQLVSILEIEDIDESIRRHKEDMRLNPRTGCGTY